MFLTCIRALAFAIAFGASCAHGLRTGLSGTRLPVFHEPSVSEDLLRQCKEHWFTTQLDHFSWVRRALELLELSLSGLAHLGGFGYCVGCWTSAESSLCLSVAVSLVVILCCHSHLQVMPSHALMLQATGPGGTETFDMRYFVCDAHNRPSEAGEPGPIFFYLGNESNVLLCAPPLCTPQLCPCVGYSQFASPGIDPYRRIQWPYQPPKATLPCLLHAMSMT